MKAIDINLDYGFDIWGKKGFKTVWDADSIYYSIIEWPMRYFKHLHKNK